MPNDMRGPNAQMPLYLARASYRQRRLRDAVRILPLVGFVGWILPVMSGVVPATSTVGLYVFVSWILMIIVCAILTASLRPTAGQTEDAGDAAGRSGQ